MIGSGLANEELFPEKFSARCISRMGNRRRSNEPLMSGMWDLLLMEEILRSPVEGAVVFPILYKVLYIPDGCWGISSINSNST